MNNLPKVEDQGAGGMANSPVSGQSVAGNADQLAELVKELKTIRSEISGLYSRQDKDRNKFSEFESDYKKFKEGGMSEGAAYDAAIGSRKPETDLEKRVNELYEKIAQSSGKMEVDAAKLLASSGLDLEDSGVQLLAARKYNSEEEVFAAIGKFVTSKQSPHKPSQDATLPKGSSKPLDAEAMTSELSVLYKTGENAERIKELETLLEWN